MEFAERRPSQNWEHLPLQGCPEFPVWFWFKSPALPEGFSIQFSPDADWSRPELAGSLTMRNVLAMVGLDPAAIWGWVLGGQPYESQQGGSPYLDSPIPPPAPGIDPAIHVYVTAGPAMPVAAPVAEAADGIGAAFDTAMAARPSASWEADRLNNPPATALESLERIDQDWKASAEIESDLVRLRRMLDDQRGRVKNLNRDFTSDERVHSTPQDKKDWLAARRALHECELRIQQCIKECDIGYATKAGKREWFEQIHRDYVEPRRPFDGLEDVQRQFEVFRKVVATLQSKMKTTNTIVRQDGERRAESILKRVQARIRDSKTKRNMLGLMLD